MAFSRRSPHPPEEHGNYFGHGRNVSPLVPSLLSFSWSLGSFKNRSLCRKAEEFPAQQQRKDQQATLWGLDMEGCLDSWIPVDFGYRERHSKISPVSKQGLVKADHGIQNLTTFGWFQLQTAPRPYSPSRDLWGPSAERGPRGAVWAPTRGRGAPIISVLITLEVSDREKRQKSAVKSFSCRKSAQGSRNILFALL